ncbi:MAG: ABC transporter permease [Planctomycetota bacterium]
MNRNVDLESHGTDSAAEEAPPSIAKMVWLWIVQQVPAIIVFLLFLLGWQGVVWLYELPRILLPTPLLVLSTLWEERIALGKGFLATGLAAMLGLFSSVLIGSCVSIAFSQAQWVRRAFYPYVIFLQTVPIVAIAPLLVTWSGYGFRTIVMVAAIISLFPIISNVTTGLISIDSNLRDLFQLHRASKWQELIKLRIPHALSHLILGMRISAGLAVIGAIVGEFFLATTAAEFPGLGAIMTGWQNQSKTAEVIAAIAVSTVLGLLVLTLVNLFGKFALRRWTQSVGFENE